MLERMKARGIDITGAQFLTAGMHMHAGSQYSLDHLFVPTE
jgi:hypothetical protein